MDNLFAGNGISLISAPTIMQRRSTYYLSIVFVLFTLAAGFGQPMASRVGAVEGVVLDGDGNPLADATVYGVNEQDMRKQIRTTSDARGRFALGGLAEGRVYLSAYKESDGYPYNFFSFFAAPAERVPVDVNVKAGSTTRDVVIQLGAKAAYLRLQITDEDGNPTAANLVFDRPDVRGPYQRGVGPNESLMVPPVPFRLTVEAKGYEPWHYGGRQWQSHDGLISLRSGETLSVSVRLRQLQ